MKFPVAITGWSAASPFGLGSAAFRDGLRAGTSAVTPAPVGEGPMAPSPVTESAVVPDFDIRAVLGRKNTRSMDRATALAVTTVGLLLDEQRASGINADGVDVGLVLGTTTGSAESMMDFTRDSLTQAKPYLVDPARFPNTVMNRAAGQCAIWHGLRGPNTTIASGHATGLSAINYGARLRATGHAETILCGAVEEFSLYRAWLERHARADAAGPPVLGEGCAIFLLEDEAAADRAGRSVFAEVLAVELRVASDDVRADAAACLRAGLSDAGVSAGDVWAVSCDSSDPVATSAVDAVFGPDSPTRVGIDQLVGDTGAAASALQIAALLGLAEGDADAAGQVAVVQSVDRDGVLGTAVLRLR